MKKRNKIMVLTFVLLSALLCLIACGSKPEAVKLQAPDNLNISGKILTWDKVENASGYTVNIDGKKTDTSGNSYDLSALTEQKKYFIQIKSLGDEKKYKASGWSQIKEYTVEPIVEQSLEFMKLKTSDSYWVKGIGSITSDEIVIPSTYKGLSVGGISFDAFKNNVNIKKIILPDTIESICGYAFAGCTALESIYLPDGLKDIQSYAFFGSGLKTLTIPDSVTILGSYACAECPNLESVKLPLKLETFFNNMFDNTPKLKNIELPDSLTYIGTTAFVGSSIESIKIPKKVYCIGESAFENTVINSVEFEKGSELKTIKESAFKGCSNLKSIVIPTSVTTIGTFAFWDCTNLTSVTFEEGSELKTLDRLFKNTCITEFTIPKSVTEIAPCAFIGLSSLTKVVFEDDSNVTVLPSQLFDGCYNLTTVYFGKNSKIKKTEHSVFNKCVKLTAINIPQSVTEIGDDTFSNCKAITTITIPSAVETIGRWAFEGCLGIKSITIPAGVTCVGRKAFSGWTKNQIIYVDGYVKAPDGWSSEWLAECSAAVIWSVV